MVHWSAAISFCVLGISGLLMLFGKYVLLPVIGYTLFAWLTALGKNLHNFVAPFFIVAVLAMIVAVHPRQPAAGPMTCSGSARPGAVFTAASTCPPGRFNAGEKVWFWVGVVGLSIDRVPGAA